jgi:DNA-binding CsgD family transcriptional regulator
MKGELLELLGHPMQEVIDLLPVSVLATAPDGRIMHANPAFCRTFRTQRERVVGLASAEHAPGSERAAFFEHWAAWERGAPRVARMELPDGEGVSRLYLLVPAPIFDSGGRFRGVLVLFFPAGPTTSAIESPPSGLAALARSVLRGVADELAGALRQSQPDLTELRVRVPALAALSEREWAVASRLAGGKRTSMIAEELHITAFTVRSHLKSVFRKTGVGSQAALVERFQQWRREASARRRAEGQPWRA